MSQHIDITKYIHNCGIYFLWVDDDVMYIGKSVNVYARAAEHKLYFAKLNRVFNRVTYIPCERDELLKKETEMICKYRPP